MVSEKVLFRKSKHFDGFCEKPPCPHGFKWSRCAHKMPEKGAYAMGGMAAGICLLLVMAFSSQAMEAASQAARVFAGGVMPALLPMMVLCRLLPAHANHERSAWRGYAGAVFFSFASGSPAQRAAGARPLGRGRVGARRAGAAPDRLRRDEPHVFHRYPGAVDGAARGLLGAAAMPLDRGAGRRRRGAAGGRESSRPAARGPPRHRRPALPRRAPPCRRP